jgi:hypothetical protein
MTSIGYWLKPAHEDRYNAEVEPIVGRGATHPVSIPILEQSEQQVTSGSRGVWVAWRNGLPPYAVRLFRTGDETRLIDTTGIRETETLFGRLEYLPGRYRIEITDAAARTTAVYFVVVSPAALPIRTTDEAAALTNGAVPADLRRTLEAALIAKNNPAWSFEAYQHIAPIARTYRPAALLRFRLIENL